MTLIRTPPLFSNWPATSTGMSIAENDVAFWINSASRCTMSLTAGPDTAISGSACTETRSYSSISDTAALMTFISINGWFQLLDSS